MVNVIMIRNTYGGLEYLRKGCFYVMSLIIQEVSFRTIHRKQITPAVYGIIMPGGKQMNKFYMNGKLIHKWLEWMTPDRS